MTIPESSPESSPFVEGLRKQLQKLQPYLRILFENRKRMLWFNAVVGVLAAAYVLFMVGHSYTVTAEILPDYGNTMGLPGGLGGMGGLGGLSSIASLAGLNIGGQSPTEVYQDLLNSESVLAPVIYSKYKTEKFDHPVNLIQYWDCPNAGWVPDSLQERYKLLTAMKNLVTSTRAEVDRESEILTVRLKMSEGQLAADVINAMMESLDNYVRTKRKSYASNQRIYIEKRLDQVKDSLSVSEQALADFRDHNKVIEVSPQLQLQQARLARTVDIQQTVFTELMSQLELAKIAEVRDTPVLNIKELSQNPVMPTSLSRRIQFMFIMFLSVVGSAAYFIYESNLKMLWRVVLEEVSRSFRSLTA